MTTIHNAIAGNARLNFKTLEADKQGVWLVARPKGTVLLLR